MLAARLLVAVLAALACAAGAVQAADGADTLVVYPLARYAVEGNTAVHGSTQLTLTAASVHSAHASDRQLRRACVLARMDSVTTAQLHELATAKQVASVLLLLPRGPVSASRLAHLRELEQGLLSSKFAIPVYFAHDQGAARDMLDDLEAREKTAGGRGGESVVAGLLATQLRLATPSALAEPKPLSTLPLQNVVAWLRDTAAAATTPDTPRKAIAVVAHYDTFGAVPSLAGGADANGSGVIAVLELARMFANLLAKIGTLGSHDLVFVLTGGGKINFQGANVWLKSLGAEQRAQIDFAVCLDAIAGHDGALHAHVSRIPKEGTLLRQFHSELVKAAGSEVPFVHRKINLAVDSRSWEHEQFSFARVAAATLSGYPEGEALGQRFPRSSLFDTAEHVSSAHLTRTINVVADALARVLLAGSPLGDQAAELGSGVLAATLKASPQYVEDYLAYMGQEARPASDTDASVRMVDVLKKELGGSKGLSVEVMEAAASTDNVLLYPSVQVELEVTGLKSPVFHFLMLLAAGGYSALVYALVRFSNV